MSEIRFLYATDLHGDEQKYNDLFDFAIEHEIGLIHLGADLLPKGSHLEKIQKKFLKGFLKQFYERCSANNIKLLCFFGNDDIYRYKEHFREYGSLLNEDPQNINGYNFIAYQYVPDYPFPLCDACKYDYDGWEPEPYDGKKIIMSEKGRVVLDNPSEYFKQKGTIQQDLDNIHAFDNTIISIHTPPSGLNLDVCGGFGPIRRVGSLSVHNWIKREQPLLVLCGHIHESHNVTGFWKAELGNTLVIQPGQRYGKTIMVMIEITNGNIKSYLIEKKQ